MKKIADPVPIFLFVADPSPLFCVCLIRYSWGAGKLHVGSDYSSWFDILGGGQNEKFCRPRSHIFICRRPLPTFLCFVSPDTAGVLENYMQVLTTVHGSLTPYEEVMQIRLKMEAGDCPPLNMNAMQNISVKAALNSLLRISHALRVVMQKSVDGIYCRVGQTIHKV